MGVRKRRQARRPDGSRSDSAGNAISTCGLPTLFIMEGGYAVEENGIKTRNVLSRFQGA